MLNTSSHVTVVSAVSMVNRNRSSNQLIRSHCATTQKTCEASISARPLCETRLKQNSTAGKNSGGATVGLQLCQVGIKVACCRQEAGPVFVEADSEPTR